MEGLEALHSGRKEGRRGRFDGSEGSEGSEGDGDGGRAVSALGSGRRLPGLLEAQVNVPAATVEGSFIEFAHRACNVWKPPLFSMYHSGLLRPANII